jgi:hypothetical protein
MCIVKPQSARLIVCDWRIDEVEGSFRIFGNPRVRIFLSFGVASIEAAAKELERIVASQTADHQQPSYFLAVEVSISSQTIGNVGFEYRSGVGTGPDVA